MKRTVEEWCARMWRGMKSRVKNRPTYADVEIRCSRSEFMIWAMPRVRAFLYFNPDQTPSPDRINDGHYDLGDMRIIDADENRRRSRFIAKYLKLDKLETEDEKIEVLAINTVATMKHAGIDKKKFIDFLQTRI